MSRSLRSLLLLAFVVALAPACVGQKLLGEVEGTQAQLQRAIRDGSKSINCAPKETAIAEANIKFAQDALATGEYYRGKQHADTAEYYTGLAAKRTNPKRCRDAPVVRVGDRDGDGYDDEVDGCPDDPEDFDSHEDDDGCPDKDNDGDGVLDASEFKDAEWVNLDQKDGTDCRNQPEDKDGFEDEDGCPDPDNDQDGILDEPDECPNDPEDIDNFEDENGCPDPDNDQDKLCDPWVEGSDRAADYKCKGKDQCPDEPEDYDGDRDEDGCPDLKAAFDGCSVKITEKVFFRFNKSQIDPRSFELLNDVATVIKSVPEKLKFRVEGHTDSKGSDRYNKKLSQKRADAVAAYLVGKGVPRARLEPTGFGEERPIDTNRSNDGRARNRRVEFNVSNVDCKRSTP